MKLKGKTCDAYNMTLTVSGISYHKYLVLQQSGTVACVRKNLAPKFLRKTLRRLVGKSSTIKGLDRPRGFQEV